MKIAELDITRDLEIEYVVADGNVLADEPVDILFPGGTSTKVVLDGTGKVAPTPSGLFNCHHHIC